MKKFFTAIAIVFILTLSSCGKMQAKPAANTDKNGSYTVEIEIYTDYDQNEIYIEYPQIKGLADESIEKNINIVIKNSVLNDLVNKSEEYFPTLKLIKEMKCQVTLHTDKLFSFVLLGSGYIDTGMHPNYGIYTMTFDLANAKQLDLSDFVDIDDDFMIKLDKKTKLPTYLF